MIFVRSVSVEIASRCVVSIIAFFNVHSSNQDNAASLQVSLQKMFSSWYEFIVGKISSKRGFEKSESLLFETVQLFSVLKMLRIDFRMQISVCKDDYDGNLQYIVSWLQFRDKSWNDHYFLCTMTFKKVNIFTMLLYLNQVKIAVLFYLINLLPFFQFSGRKI